MISTLETGVSADLFFETVNGYQKTAALKAAVELDVFTRIGEGCSEVEPLARRCGASVRGMRVLCDYLVAIGFLGKEHDAYALPGHARAFLDRRSPSCLTSLLDFLLSPHLTDGFRDLAAVVRNGGTVVDGSGTLAPDHPVWAHFARCTSAVSAPRGIATANIITRTMGNRACRVLDIAAGHGWFGIAMARQHPQTTVTAVDWPVVLEVARENAAAEGIDDRYQTIAGSALDVDLGTDYDVVILGNLLHHLDENACHALLCKARKALRPGGYVAVVEFILDEERVSPPPAATFGLLMLATTPGGDVYSASQLKRMLSAAGFADHEVHEVPPYQGAVVARAR